MLQPNYYFDAENGFVIEQYNECLPFASFLPGIAGVEGRPAWAFYVNRGQAIASFGVRNKDGAFLEFFPADKAYQLTAARGFRTFLKITDGEMRFNHEPFQRGAGGAVTQRMHISRHEVGVEEIHPCLGLGIRADMFTLPESGVAALVRRVEIFNASSHHQQVEIVDGLPQVQPFAMNQWLLKFMSRTSEAFMRVEGVEQHVPFYRLKVWPTDTPQVEPVIGGNFFVGFCQGQRNPVIVDPERVFGQAGDFSRAERFFAQAPLELAQQIIANQTPSAFQTLSLDMPPGSRHVFYGIYGHADSLEACQKFVEAAAHSGYLEAKREANRRLVDDISRRAFTCTAQPHFDAHVQQCYLDNGLRGGFPMPVPGGRYLYLYGRKHGDLERDYNDFLLQDTPYSEGNGDFRDVLQNRRLDLFFEPALDVKNIRYFFNLIQPDGYNPCALRNARFRLAPAKAEAFAALHSRFPGLSGLLAGEFKYAELWQCLEAAGEERENLLGQMLAQADEIEDAEFDRGYWSDHWTYLVDLLMNYAAIFPDRLTALLQDERYTFFDPTHAVAPRAKKYQLTPKGLRQYNAVHFSAEKKALIDSRAHDRYRVRAEGGHGDIVHTRLLGKILTLIVNKLASLDPAGVGIEMEADRPGWCDALNGLPGLFGSSVNETIELRRLADFTRQALKPIEGDCAVPIELADFLTALQALLQHPALSAEAFWQHSGALKEAYRESVFMGFAGPQRSLMLHEVRTFLDQVCDYLDEAIDKARSPEGILTYFTYEAVRYVEMGEGRADVLQFRQKPLPLFLEGFVHALRIADTAEAHRLYRAARHSELFDKKLGMYRLNVPLGDDALELGRIGVFNDGWLENGSIFLHMHYKFVLEMLRSGLTEAFYADMNQLLVAFHDPRRYGRNPIENSSFLVSSGFAIDPRQHGRGCVARLSGSTVEFLHLWTHLFLGPAPFSFEGGELRFLPTPALASFLFSEAPQVVNVFDTHQALPADSAACSLFSDTLLVYVNPKRQNTFGDQAVTPVRYHLYPKAGRTQTIEGAYLPSPVAHALREREFSRVDVELG